MTLSKDEVLVRNALLKRLREEHADTLESTRTHLKTQKAVRREICQAMRQGAATVPEISAASSLPAHQVLWHVTAMKKYDRVIEVGQCGEYYQYELVKETKA
jgi:predicted transcriptional regulator